MKSVELTLGSYFGRSRSTLRAMTRALALLALVLTPVVGAAAGTGCTAPGSIQVDHVRVSDRSWFTSFGLRVGDPTQRLRRLYPRAKPKKLGRLPHAYWLVTRLGACVGLCDARLVTIPVLLAE